MTVAEKWVLAVVVLLLAAVGSIALLFALAVPNHGVGAPDVALTNERWEIISNTELNDSQFILVAALPFGEQIRKPTEEEFRRLLKLLMRFEATTESSGKHFDYELGYQAGMSPTSIYVDLRNDQMLFRIARSRFVYRSQSRDAFLAAMNAIITRTR